VKNGCTPVSFFLIYKYVELLMSYKHKPVAPEPDSFEVAISIEKLERNKLPGTDHIPVLCCQ
jgi:hypothetical protein